VNGFSNISSFIGNGGWVIINGCHKMFKRKE